MTTPIVNSTSTHVVTDIATSTKTVTSAFTKSKTITVRLVKIYPQIRTSYQTPQVIPKRTTITKTKTLGTITKTAYKVMPTVTTIR